MAEASASGNLPSPPGLAVNIGEAARRTGISAKMIRHYEAIGLLPTAKRTYSGYRLYGARELHTLRFVRHARALGFSIKQIGELVGLWQNRRRPSARVKELALAHVDELEARIREMRAMKATLAHLANVCQGDDRPDCPILEGLEHSDHASSSSTRSHRRIGSPVAR
jgi:MerR family copper efflux transcriptional regulator